MQNDDLPSPKKWPLDILLGKMKWSKQRNWMKYKKLYLKENKYLNNFNLNNIT